MLKNKKNNYKFYLIGKKDIYFLDLIKHLKKKKISHKYLFIDKKIKINFLRNILRKDKFDYLISYRNPKLLTKEILSFAKKLNINFHPSPPKYRGVGGFNLAILNSDKEYGVTAHIMTDKLDNGMIIDFTKFKISKDIELNELINKTRKLQFAQILKLLNYLTARTLDLKSIKIRNKKYVWGKKIFYLKDLEKLYTIDINKNNNFEIKKKIRATLMCGFAPKMVFKNYEFLLKNDK